MGAATANPMKTSNRNPNFGFKVKTTIGFLITLLVLGTIGWLSIRSLNDSIQAEQTLSRTNQEFTQIDTLLRLLKQAEAGHYAYIVRNDPRQFEQYSAAADSVNRSLENLDQLFGSNPTQKKQVERLRPLVQEKLRIMSTAVQKRRDGTIDSKQEEFGRFDELSNAIAKIAADMESDQNLLVGERERLAEASANRTHIIIVVGIALAIAIAAVARIVVGRDFKARQNSELLVKELQQKSLVDSQLSQMTNLLQSCLTSEEASEVISHSARHLFPNDAGTLYVFRNSRNVLEVAAEWGEGNGKASPFAPHQCWALRQGQMHQVNSAEVGIGCAHARYPDPYICLPMMAHGEVLALLHVQLNKDSQAVEAQGVLLKVFTEHMALALSNLNLRITLRQQSVRDPLTGLFNRRYLEETLTLETERAKRDVAPFSIIMLDLDNFKRFNDTHGHEAGDTVLQTVGRFLHRHVRGGDIACRYGGEEFTMVLPGAGSQEAFHRAEQLCEGVRALRVEFKGQNLGPLTLSAGIATYPDQGETGEHVQQAADAALYAAKAEGRDRVVMSEISPAAHLVTG
jgi:diguanylate cyclase (GGDEF)-like protein